MVLGSPKAWLGTAYHFVLERIFRAVAEGELLETAVARLWNEAITAQEKRASRHLLNRRFGKSESWPGHFLVRASVELRARQIVSAKSSDATSGNSTTMREEEFTAFGGKLLGRPDVVRVGEILDYKSGSILEYDDDAQSEVVKASYVRQLRIYGYLVRENLGWWPARGVLLPFIGPPVEVPLEPADCEREAAEAVAIIDSYNGKLQVSASGLGSPSPQSCRWCPFKLICPSFWQNASPEWSGQLDGAAVEGIVVRGPDLIQGGAAFAISLDVQYGSEARGISRIAPLSVAVHEVVASFCAGDRVRLVGLRARPDGTLVTTQRTVVTRVADVPMIIANPDLPDQ
jgi:hypothetical protein